ncbi:MAG: response regulator [Lachnospiraceae bacterium]|nr:response regulator [Lachnospiraceae bacterium]
MADWVIVVDDDIANLKLAGTILSRNNIRVTALNSGQSMLDYVRAHGTPDLILLDILMPGMDGFETLQKYRSYEAEMKIPKVPVAFLTADEDKSTESRGFEMGVSDFIRKPIDPDNLTSRVGNLLSAGKGDDRDIPSDIDLKTLSQILEERNIPHNAMWMGREAFSDVYHYMIRYMDRYRGTAYKLLYTVQISPEVPAGEHPAIMETARRLLQDSLRNSDIMMKIGENHFFLLLPELNRFHVENVIERIGDAWKNDPASAKAGLNVEAESIHSDDRKPEHSDTREPDWIVVVDDDMANLTIAGSILSREKMRVSALQSGQAFLDFIKDNTPDLILLDVKMPDMDGFETLKQLRGRGGPAQRIPVIFLTGDEDESAETRGFALGAMDFIRKPIIPSSLVMRVRHILELVRLQNRFGEEVQQKTEESEKLTLQVIRAMAEAVEAKESVTRGHSGRVAKYAREIARRCGYSEKALNEIHILGLLHDVGKIEVPASVLNKKGKLSGEEYGQVKPHAEAGARILQSIKEMPLLARGARWHHERYDGTGYPDGLKGDSIPEEARIIAVADAYDAMTSKRPYRSPLPQEVARAELEMESGKQFDPRFAAIMIAMIDEDAGFTMRED